MLVREPPKRLTARACLEHTWFHKAKKFRFPQNAYDGADELDESTHSDMPDLGVELRHSISMVQEEKRRGLFKAAAQAVIMANRLVKNKPHTP